jgi:flagella synthesis protein FlgN
MGAVLIEEIREVEAFVALLREEETLLASAGNVDTLMPLVERKSGYAVRLKALADRREQLLAAANLEKGRAGMDAWLARTPGAENLRPHWQKLLTMAGEARDRNETNGKLIGIHWQHNQAALAALMSASDRAATYGPDGQQKSGGGGRMLGSA